MTDLSGVTLGEITEDEFSLEELTALALGSPPDMVIGDDAVPWRPSGGTGSGLLPSWYMPPAMRHLHGWRIWAVAVLVVLFLAIEASGLCSAFGQLVVG